jgi:hypothetical protein
VGFLARLFGRKSRGPEAPAPTRDDTLSSTYVPPPTPDVHPAERTEEEVDENGGDADDAREGDGGGDGGGNGGGGGD